jgi:predicted DNA-binding transcriptional regulator AlpA
MAKKAATPDANSLRKEMGYITEPDVAAILGISLLTLRNRQSAGSVPPHYKIGKTKLYRVSEVEAWINRRAYKRGAWRSSKVAA